MEVPFQKVEVFFKSYHKNYFTYSAKINDSINDSINDYSVVIIYHADDIYHLNIEAKEIYYLDPEDLVEYISKTKTFKIMVER